MMTDKILVNQRDGMEWGCVLSEDEKYRYALWRIWDETKPNWMFVLLNPSTATHLENDPTITRQIERARRGGAGGIMVVNAGAIRETDSDKAVASSDPIGPHNAFWVEKLLWMCRKHIAGWGPKAKKFGGDVQIKYIFHKACVELSALKINKDGSPQHPLYIAYDVPLIPLVAAR